MKLAALAGALTALALAAPHSQAQTWPQRPITLIMPFPAGGPSDALARAVAAKMAGALKTSIVVENVGGAGGSIGLQRVARSAPDGYTIGFGTVGTHAANMLLYAKPAYDARGDFSPLGQIGSAPTVLLVKQGLPVKSFDEFAAYLKAHAGEMSYGSAGVGSISHLACLMLLTDLKADVVHVPYKGVAPAMTGLMGGETDFMCDQTTTVLPQVAGGRVRAIAMLTREPFDGLPGVAPAQTSGLTAIDFRSWNGLFAPRGTPAQIVQQFNTAINDALADPELVRQMGEVGVEFPERQANTPEQLAQQVDQALQSLTPLLRGERAQPH